MNRRRFFKLLGMAAAGAVTAPFLAPSADSAAGGSLANSTGAFKVPWVFCGYIPLTEELIFVSPRSMRLPPGLIIDVQP